MTIPAALVEDVARRVLRTDLDQPGFAHLDLGLDLTPRDFRAWVIDLGRSLDRLFAGRFGGRLVFVSVSRFDQQAQTRPHRDGGPDASLLLLGYEPSEVPSRLLLLDYTRAAHEKGMTPLELLDCCNPAFTAGEDLLRPYTSEVTGFTPGRYQVVVVNNGCLPHAQRDGGMLGVLHHAAVTPTPGAARWIDSVQMAVAGPGVEALGEAEVRAFVEEGRGAGR